MTAASPSPRPVLVTAGATRNPVDAMRFLSANSSGRTGAAIADALSAHTKVHLLGSPEALLRSGGAPSTEAFGATRDLMARMQAWATVNPTGILVHAAAVGDYEAAEQSAGKTPSQQAEWVIRLRPAPKIADQVLDWSPELSLITFKAAGPETSAEELVQICRKQLERTRSTLVFGNVIGALGSTATLVDLNGSEAFPRRDDAMEALVARIRALL